MESCFENKMRVGTKSDLFQNYNRSCEKPDLSFKRREGEFWDASEIIAFVLIRIFTRVVIDGVHKSDVFVVPGVLQCSVLSSLLKKLDTRDLPMIHENIPV